MATKPTKAPAEKKTISATYQYERDTKKMRVHKENIPEGAEAMTNFIYVNAKMMADLGDPLAIRVTIEAA